MNRNDEYLGQRSCRSRVIVRTHTHWTDCSTWTINVLGRSLQAGSYVA